MGAMATRITGESVPLNNPSKATPFSGSSDIDALTLLEYLDRQGLAPYEGRLTYRFEFAQVLERWRAVLREMTA
jgi:hypothetical protein